jgi:hypothetical protein
MLIYGQDVKGPLVIVQTYLEETSISNGCIAKLFWFSDTPGDHGQDATTAGFL